MSSTDVLQEHPGVAQTTVLSSFLHWEEMHLTSLSSGAFSTRGSHTIKAPPSILQHPGLIPTHLQGPPNPVCCIIFTQQGLEREDLQEIQAGTGLLYMEHQCFQDRPL